MLRIRHRVAALFGCVVALGIAGSALAQTVQVGNNVVLTLGTVQLDGGNIDLTNGAVIVNTATFGFVPQGSGGPAEIMTGGVGQPEYGAAAIHDAIEEGANYYGGGSNNVSSGFWNGTNGVMSTTAQNDPNGITAVGYIDDSIAQYTIWRNTPVNTNQTIIATTYYGDANLDGNVDPSDYSLWLGTVLNPAGNNVSPFTGGYVNWIDGDFNGDGVVDPSDYSLWLGGLLSPAYVPLGFNPSLVGAASPGVSPVPEPGTLSLIASLVGFATLVRFLRKGRS